MRLRGLSSSAYILLDRVACHPDVISTFRILKDPRSRASSSRRLQKFCQSLNEGAHSGLLTTIPTGSMEFQPLQPLPRAPRRQSVLNPHSKYFQSFRHPLFIKQPSPITHIHFCPSRPHRYAVSSSTRVLIYAPKTGKVVKTVSRFKEVARSAEFRKDGKLLVAGSDDGLVQVFDVSSRAILRTMKGHNQSVQLLTLYNTH